MKEINPRFFFMENVANMKDIDRDFITELMGVQPYILNPDKDIVKEIRDRLKDTNGYCPCVIPDKWNNETKCICRSFIEQESGECHCGLYIKIKD